MTETVPTIHDSQEDESWMLNSSQFQSLIAIADGVLQDAAAAKELVYQAVMSLECPVSLLQMREFVLHVALATQKARLKAFITKNYETMRRWIESATQGHPDAVDYLNHVLANMLLKSNRGSTVPSTLAYYLKTIRYAAATLGRLRRFKPLPPEVDMTVDESMPYSSYYMDQFERLLVLPLSAEEQFLVRRLVHEIECDPRGVAAASEDKSGQVSRWGVAKTISERIRKGRGQVYRLLLKIRSLLT